jgi:GNAT superfamily N-acetyltransferase
MLRPCGERDLIGVWDVINDGARAYCGVIPADCWREPYMPIEELQHQIAQGVRFWGCELDAGLVGVMGLQEVRDVALIRHAYVRTQYRNQGIGGRLLAELRSHTEQRLLVGTWAAARWAILFYEKHGFQLVPEPAGRQLLHTYWTISQRQAELSVVLAAPDPRRED